MVRLDNVGKRYGFGSVVLSDISLRLTGASGAGNSTSLKIIYFAERPSRGLVTIFQRDMALVKRTETVALRRRIGVLFQGIRRTGLLRL